MRKLLSALALPLLVSGCASFKYLANDGHAQYARGDYGAAATSFAKEAGQPGANQVLFLLDQGSALFAAGQFKEATDVFLKAEKLCEIIDYTSISEEVGTLLTSDNIRGYKGEDYEKVLINVYLALAFAAQGKLESAQVEARKINQILYRMIHEGKRNYEESPFARYLAAMLWEADGSWNDAYIDYKKTYELNASFPNLGPDLLLSAQKMRFTDEVEMWQKKFPAARPREWNKGHGELVVIYQRGLSPVKVARAENSSLPRYVSRPSSDAGAQLRQGNAVVGRLQGILDIEGTSIRYLEDRITRMAAAKLAGTAVKGAVAYGLAKATGSDDAGMLAFVGLLASDHADLRSWRSLPAELLMIRLPLPAGTYDNFELDRLGSTGFAISSVKVPPFTLKPGKKAFVVLR